MTLLILTIIVYLFLFIGLSCGVLMKRAPLTGSCGGVSMPLGVACVANCSHKCKKEQTVRPEGKISDEATPSR